MSQARASTSFWTPAFDEATRATLNLSPHSVLVMQSRPDGGGDGLRGACGRSSVSTTDGRTNLLLPVPLASNPRMTSASVARASQSTARPRGAAGSAFEHSVPVYHSKGKGIPHPPSS
eukprot:Polyplicarium_translucidae@DN1770_c0_g1_i1.p1